MNYYNRIKYINKKKIYNNLFKINTNFKNLQKQNNNLLFIIKKNLLIINLKLNNNYLNII